jgi:Subtilase family.
METIGQVNANKKTHADKLPTRRYGYFRDDQIMFLVTHDAGTLSNDLLAQFRAGIDAQLASGKTVEDPPQIISFPQIDPKIGDQRLAQLRELESQEQGSGYRPERSLRPFSILTYNLTGTSEDPLQLLVSIKQLRTAFVGKNFPEPPVVIGSSGVIPASSGEQPTSPTAGEPEVELTVMKVEDISPNWLMSVASQGSGSGGPGGLPTPFQGPDGTEEYEFDDFLDKHAALYGKGANVDVAILDTAPCAHDLVLAPKEHPDNDLIRGLLGPDGKLQPYLASYEQLKRIVSTSLNRHDYKMTDHGLFAAGIIHSIVPEAKIHLIEVLNEFGVGDLLSLAEGIKKVFEEIYQLGSGRQLVVNCSWMLDLPVCDEHCASISDEGVEDEFEEAVRKFVEEEQDQAYTLRATCNSIFLVGGQVFAAAGNDWSWAKKKKELAAEKTGKATPNPDEPRPNAPEARYPAAFASVVGVGAIPRGTRHTSTKYKASSYSNLGDKPAGIGIMTLGGEEGAKKGVLGLYLEDQYPVEIPNPDSSEKYKRVFETRARNEGNKEKNAWAWWAGTSFATPILTGAVAAVLSAPGFADDPQVAVRALYTKGIIQDRMTDAEEDVMHVSQGA